MKNTFKSNANDNARRAVCNEIRNFNMMRLCSAEEQKIFVEEAKKSVKKTLRRYFEEYKLHTFTAADFAISEYKAQIDGLTFDDLFNLADNTTSTLDPVKVLAFCAARLEKAAKKAARLEEKEREKAARLKDDVRSLRCQLAFDAFELDEMKKAAKAMKAALKKAC